ncbi:MAG: PhoH family protein [Xanthomonadaceae bacterium]|nr:PhoH family protein [Xanthomonadaceae bacterium]
METKNFELESDNRRLANLAGNLDEHIRLIEKRCFVEIANRGAKFLITGADSRNVETAQAIIEALFKETPTKQLTPDDVHLMIAEIGNDTVAAPTLTHFKEHVIKTKGGVIKGRTLAQKEYLHTIATNDINFGIGPAGTGKTYLAVAAAVEALQKDEVRRIILVRPAVEAGEKLGFLPGDLVEKIDPYLRPLYDALYEMLGFETVHKLIERHTIEIAPLAFMRGRTLNDAFIILDEAQNTTIEQMKMFLTRIGFGSTAVVTGDASQIDLPRHLTSGLNHAIKTLDGVDGIGISYFTAVDVVRHPLVAKIINAYEIAEANDEAAREARKLRREAMRKEHNEEPTWN